MRTIERLAYRTVQRTCPAACGMHNCRLERCSAVVLLFLLPLVGVACSKSLPTEQPKAAEQKVARPDQPAAAVSEPKQEAPKPAETPSPVETPKATGTPAAAESKPAETTKPAETPKTAETPATVPPKVVLQTVRILSEPSGAEILVDHNTLSGKTTPADVELSPGTHVVQVKKSQYEPSEERTVNVQAGQGAADVSFALKASVPEEFTITIRCEPTGATLTADGTSVSLSQGQASLKRPKTMDNLTLKVSASSHASVEKRYSRSELESANCSVTIRLNPYLKIDPKEAEVWVDGESLAADSQGRRELRRNTADSYRLIVSCSGYTSLTKTYSYDDLRQREFSLSLEKKPADTWLERAAKLTRQSGWPGHTKTVYAVAFSPKKRLLASAGRDEQVRLSSYPEKKQSNGELPATSEGELKQSKPVLSLAFSPDGQWLATGGADRKVRLWDLQSREAKAELPHDDWIWSVAFTHDGAKLATAAGDGTVALWGVTSHSRVGNPKKLHDESIESIAFNPSDKILASAGADGKVILWTVDGGETATLRSGSKAVHSLAFSPDGATLASAGDDNTITLWDVAKREQLATLGTHDQPVRCVAFSPDGKILASAGSDKKVKLWDVAAKKEARTLALDEEVGCVAFSPSGWLLAAGGMQGGVAFWQSAD